MRNLYVCVYFPAQGPTVHPPPATTGPVQWNGPPPSPVSIGQSCLNDAGDN